MATAWIGAGNYVSRKGVLGLTWQEELRKLDDDFAAGRLSADDYKLRREQVLSSAIAPGTTGAPQEGQAEQKQAPQHGSGGVSSESDRVNADATQIVSPASLPQATQETSQQPASSGGANAQHQQGQHGTAPETTQAAPAADSGAERTQAVSQWAYQQPAGSPPSGFQQPYQQSPAQRFANQQQPWNAPEDDSSPPWGGSEFPPVSPSTDAEWVRQGPEVFEGGSKSNGKSKGGLLAGSLAVVLLAGVGTGAFLLWGTGSEPEPTPEPVPAEDDDGSMPDLPGTVVDYPDVETFDDVPALNYLTEAESAQYEQAGAGASDFLVHQLPSDSRALVLHVEASDTAEAEDATDELREVQIVNGAEDMEGQPEGIHVTEFADEDRDQLRAHYAAGDTIVRVEVVTTEGKSVAERDFDDALNAQLELLPADA